MKDNEQAFILDLLKRYGMREVFMQMSDIMSLYAVKETDSEMQKVWNAYAKTAHKAWSLTYTSIYR